MENYQSIVSQRLKWLRKSRKLSQEKLGKALGITRQRVSLIESEERGGISLDTLLRLCDFYGCSLDYMVGRVANPTEMVESGVNTQIYMTETCNKCLFKIKHQEVIEETSSLIKDLKNVIRKHENHKGGIRNER